MFCIYKLRNPHNRGEYVGHTNDYERRMSEHRRKLTVECSDFEHEIVFDNIPSRAEANEMEKVYIDVYGTFDNGYNETRGGSGGTEFSEEVKEKVRQATFKSIEDGTHYFSGDENNRQRIADGTHHFCGDSNPSHQRVADGTHHLLGGEVQRKTARRLVEDGTHHLLGSKHNLNRIESGEHNLIRKNNPSALPEYDEVRSFFFLCVEPMKVSIREKRKQVYAKYPNIKQGTIYSWIRKWQAETE